MAAPAEAPTAPRVTKRRAETRRRLLDAAFLTFAEQGFGRSTVEQVCERAGYSRGAFYSNFVSLDELFLAMWERRSQELLIGMGRAFDAVTVPDPGNPRAAIAGVAAAVPLDDAWYRISAEFTAHALRNPALRGVMVAREEAISATLAPIITALLRRLGRGVTDPDALVQALIAVHDGTALQCLMEPGDPAVRGRRIALFVEVVMAYSGEQRA
jgi:AcrR family transcriptional regulator